MHVACTEMKSVLTSALVFAVLLGDAKAFNTFKVALTTRTSWSPEVVRASCLLTPDQGPCRANVMMYYYDPATMECNTFAWGGCMGNGNRFDTKDECNTTCLSQPNAKSKAPRWCQLNFDYGFCFGEVNRYYYDRFWRVCKPALYSGCGGNRNNFYDFNQCETVCRFGLKPITTTTRGTGKRKVIIINPPTTLKYDPAATTKATIPPKF